MKICPTCKKSYPDDGLNFCLDDGSILAFADADLPETVMMSQPLPTSPAMNTAPQTQPSGPFGQTQGQQSGWNPNPQFSMQPPAKKSRTWLWLLGIFGIGLLLCGGGGALFIGLAIYNAPENDGPGTSNPAIANGTKPPPSPGAFDDKPGRKLDLAKWVGSSEHGSTTMSGDELVMSSARKGYFFAMGADALDKTENATVRVSARNIDSQDTGSGFGLIFHCDPKSPLQQGYAFLIDSSKRRYRVIRHQAQKPSEVVKWTNSSAIKDGSEINKIEVRHKNDINDLYINGTKVTSVRNIYGFKGGVAGLYAADGIKIGFRDLEIAQ